MEMGSSPAAFPKAWKEELVLWLCCSGGRGLWSRPHVVWESEDRKEVG